MFDWLCKKKNIPPARTMIVGLGNPGAKYLATRHNVGFAYLDYVRDAWQCDDFVYHKKFSADVSEGFHDGHKILLAKPQTFMNHSGQSVRALVDFYKIPLENIVIVHDELDLPLGEWKISDDSRAAGHNGVQDIFNRLGSQQIRRLRIGIDNRDDDQRKKIAGSDYVLQKFSPDELEKIKNLLPEISHTSLYR